MDRAALQHWARDRGVAIGPDARRLPKGALARFDRAIRNEQSVDIRRPLLSRSVPTDASREQFIMRIFGHSRDKLRHLTANEIEAIHFQIADDFRYTSDPIAPAGVRSSALLDSAAGRSSTGMGSFLKYPTVEMAAAALMHSVVHNHPFYNGNKRTALVSMLVFLDENGLVLNSSQDDVFKWTVRIASHRLGAKNFDADLSDVEVQMMAEWLHDRCRKVEAGERVVTFAELRRRLQAFNCNVQITSNRGGRAIITREVLVKRRTIFGSRDRKETRQYNLPYGGDGREVSKSRIMGLRKELRLSELYGIDSASFYGNDKQPVDAFIAEYRKTLRRLARL
ncbi:type II toxin-antitoxin system death-on-curing family toxin [Rathayibacter sp. VKM Ac-2927]|uniref:type II toxin-antitoxin system death-on-curing family toxin n=1 Tax=Rathayibacter sp. VKM Ac-2927 TaxID=2929478 RepID=UPI001FB2A56C|nr:type II toxin-antitoxin system death-on-curing family toxin [Rathayibacter sp. VKM Ac-2927]